MENMNKRNEINATIKKEEKLPKPTLADYEKREKIENQLSKGEANDELESAYLNMMNSFDWSTRIFEQDGKYGLVNSRGEILVQPFFENFMAGSLDEHKIGSWVVAMQNEKCGVLICDGTGSWLIKPEYDFIGYPNTITHVYKDGKWGVIDLSKKEFIIPLECDEVSSYNGFMFENGIATYSKNGKTGVINEDGAFTEAIFEEVECLPEEVVKVKLNGRWGFINDNNQYTQNEDDAAWNTYID